MTILDLLNSLEREFERIAPSFKIYKAKLPQPEKDWKDVYPYVLINLGDGEDGEYDSYVDVVITFGVIDNPRENLGYITLYNLVEDIRQWAKEKIIDSRYMIKGDIQWAVDMEENRPYSFGAVLFKVGVPCPVPKLLTEEGY